MKKILLAFALVALVAGPVSAQTAAEHIQAGDQAYAQFDDTKALEDYQAALDIADVITGKDKDAKTRQQKLYTDATELARKAVAANPDDTWGHFQLAAANGKRLLMLGNKEQIAASKAVKAEIDRAIELDPTNDLAYHALGRWHRRIAEISGAKRFFGSILYGSIPKGSFEESEQYLRKAIELDPTYVNHYYELGLTLLALKKTDEAAECFQKAIDLPRTMS